jgi:chemotaxis family two-component system response regulator Rcp1
MIGVQMQNKEILLVEDNAADVRLTQEILRKSGMPCTLRVARDGEQAMQMLRRQNEHQDLPLPDLVLLDLNLPLKDGREVLAELKLDPVLRSIPVIVLTTSRADADISACYGLHANSYITKPVDLGEFEKVVEDIRRYWFGRVQLPPHG